MITFAEIPINSLLKLAPTVFGIISVKTKIRIVSTAETKPKYASPNTMVACAPTPAAPTVCATVFKDNIADKGLSISDFNYNIVSAFLSPNSIFDFKKETGVDSKTASIIEHTKEVKRATNK